MSYSFYGQVGDRQEFFCSCDPVIDEIFLGRLIQIFGKQCMEISAADAHIVRNIRYTDSIMVIVLDIFKRFAYINVLCLLAGDFLAIYTSGEYGEERIEKTLPVKVVFNRICVLLQNINQHILELSCLAASKRPASVSQTDIS